jgi:tetratricopeptide (TPR) repeat protein
VTRLSRIRQLQVRSTSSIPKQYEGKNPLVVGRKLGVDALLGGSIQRIGENLRITVQFVRVHDGVVLWAHQFDEKAARLFKVEDSIAEQTLAALRTTLSIEEERQIARSPTASSEAYEDYLKGRYFSNKRTEEALWTAIGYFEHAIQHDSNYAIAYIGLADCYNLLVFLGTIPTPEGTAKTIASARKALEIDASLGEAHTSIGFAKFCQGVWDEAEYEFGIARKTAPNYATTYHWLSEFFVARGKFDDAVAMVQRARELDPMSLTINANIGSVLYFARQYSRAIEEMKSAQQLDRYFLLTHWYLGLNLTQLGKYDEAIAELQTALGLSQGSPLILATLGHAFAVSRRKEKARKIIAELKHLSTRRYVSPYDLAVVYAGLAEKSEALRWLSKAHNEGSNWMMFLNVDPRLDRIRSERGFEALARKVGVLPALPASK